MQLSDAPACSNRFRWRPCTHGSDLLVRRACLAGSVDNAFVMLCEKIDGVASAQRHRHGAAAPIQRSAEAGAPFGEAVGAAAVTGSAWGAAEALAAPGRRTFAQPIRRAAGCAFGEQARPAGFEPATPGLEDRCSTGDPAMRRVFAEPKHSEPPLPAVMRV